MSQDWIGLDWKLDFVSVVSCMDVVPLVSALNHFSPVSHSCLCRRQKIWSPEDLSQLLPDGH